MKVSYHNPANGALVADSVTGISFGAVRKGQHCDMPVLVKPGKTTEHNIYEMKMFLQANGGLNLSSFGHFTSGVFATGVDYSTNLTGHFTLATGATGWPVSGAPGISGLDILCASGSPQGFVWLDMEVGADENSGPKPLNYRFCYDYN